MADTNLLILAREFKALRNRVQEVLKMPVGPQGLQGDKGEQGVKGETGAPGKNGKDGKDGVNGLNGTNGTNGVDGADGADGLDGVGVQNAYIDFDNSLVIVLTSGQEINAGFLSQETKESVVATFKQGAQTLNELLPVQTGNENKVLTTDGTNVFWNTTSGGTETDPVVGAVNGLVKANGAGTIAAAVAGTDYLAPAAIANMLETSDIGVTVQGYSAVLAGTTASFTTADETKLDGIEAGADVTDAANVEPLVNTHLNTSTAASGEVLSWNGTDYDWITPPAGYSDSSVDAHLNTSTATSGQVLGWTGTDYDWVDQSGGGGGGALTISNKTAAYTVVAGDLGKIINCTSGTFTVSLTAAATLGAGFNCWVWNTGTGAITIDPNSTETIDGVDTLILRQGEGLQIVCDGTNFQTGDKKTMRLYAENTASTSTRPVASGITSSVAVGRSAVASGQRSSAFGDFASATATQALAVGQSVNANSNYSTALGTNSAAGGAQTATGAGAMALGGSYASGTDSFAAAVANNTSSYGAKASNAVAIGRLALASGSGGLALGAQATASNSSIALSCNGLRSIGATASSNGGCIAIGGNVTASAFSSVAIGQDAVSADSGKMVFSPVRLAVNGDAQTGTKVIAGSTTNATPKALSTGDFGAADQIILANNTAYAFSGIVIAKQSGSTNAASWKVEGMIVRGANAASTTLVFSTVTPISNVPLWTLALSADTTNGGLAVTFTGAAATNIRTVATIQTSEVTYA